QDYATIIDMKGAKVEGMYIEDFYANTPAVTSHSYKDGKAFYVGARLDKTFHEAFYNTLIEDLDLEGDLPVKSGKSVSIQVRRDNENDYIFIMNFTEKTQIINFEKEVEDMITGEQLKGEIKKEKKGVRVGNRKREEEKKIINFEKEVEDMIRGEKLKGEIELEKYGVRVGIRPRED